MSATPGMAFVVVMHLSPDHTSLLDSILRRNTKMKVIAVVETTPILPNQIYVISPALRLEMTDGHLRVSASVTTDERRRSIDLFFRSLAQAHQERALCIVLSGTGSDGSLGLKRIKEFGGVALAQSPEDAEFDGMPRAAIDTGLIDFTLPAEEMSQKLSVIWENARRIELPSPPPDFHVEQASGESEHAAEEALASIRALLRERTGHDFAHYKRGTVLRRLERRMQVNAVPDLPSYRQFLDTEPQETFALLQDMLISVTNFFRDPQAFASLASALKSKIDNRPAGGPFRAWVAGCATGEEAYSLVISLRELLGSSGPAIQLFASDIDQRAIAAARTGIFPPAIATDISRDRLERFFVEDAAGYRVTKEIRESVVFSVHNALSDAPFTKMELVSCRNVLIYLDRVAQSQLLSSFHFALKPHGLLFLGSSETVDASDSLFESVDKSQRIYASRPVPVRARVPSLIPQRVQPVTTPVPSLALAVQARPPLEMLHQRVLGDYAPPTVLVDADDTVLHVSQRASHLLRFPEGAPTSKLMALARPELRGVLRAAMSRATATGKAVRAPDVQLRINGEPSTLTVTVRPVASEYPPGLLLLVFDEVAENMGGNASGPMAPNLVLESLEAELQRTQERLRTTVGESAASTEELRASNEELQTINEELRSTTEELETSREELQAVNEELTTVNTELTFRIDETSKVNDDLQNLMTSADIGTVFIDREMRVKRFTPQAATVFNLLQTDVGRPLLDITHHLDYPELVADLKGVLEQLNRVEREITSTDGRWFLARAVPYRTSDNRIDGAVLAFFDVTARRAAEHRLDLSEQRMALVAESMRDYAIVTMNQTGQIVTWSAGAEKIFGYSEPEVMNQPFELLFVSEDRLAGVPSRELARARSLGRAEDDRWHLRKDGSRVYCSGITASLGEDATHGFAKIARDFTDLQLIDQVREASLKAERASAAQLQEANAMKDEFLAVVSHELKNPLSVIQLNVHLWSRLPSAAGDPLAARSAEVIKSAVASQAQLINDLLELSRANMGKIALEPVVLDLAEIARRVLDVIAEDAEEKHQSVELMLEPVRILGDPIRIEQIVWNLASNAVKFTPDGGLIRVAISVEESLAKLVVEDTGVGIEAEHLDSVFEMFRQVQSATNRSKSGLGIGLALVKQLAERHGGRVEAQSDGLGKGARFTVWLPIAGSLDAVPLPAHPAAGLAGLSLMLVDDQSDLLEVFGALMETEGARVVLANSADEALRFSQEASFDAIVSDIAMPVLDGYWLASQLRNSERTRAVPLIAVSGMARDIDREKALRAGFDIHLSKPLDIEGLRAGILDAITKTKPQ